MMENGTSLADLAAVSNMGNNGLGNGGWLWFIIVLFAIFGNGFFGGNGQAYATSADVQRSTDQVEMNARFDSLFNNQANNAMSNMSLIDRNAMDNQSLIAANKYDNAVLIKDSQYTALQNTYATTNAMNSGFNDIGNRLCSGFNGLDKTIYQTSAANTQAMNDGFAAVNQNLCNLSHQITDGVCAIKTQMLQDKYDNLRNEYNLSTMANANSVQTATLLNALGSWYAKPPYAPYYGGTAVA